MYLLDTNVVSMLDVRRQTQVPELVAWLYRNGASTFLSVVTVAEMESGILKLRRTRKNKRADELAGLLKSILSNFGDRVLPFDVETALHSARLGELAHRQPVGVPDLFIAATAARHGLTLLTHNLAEFSRLAIPMLDPFVQLPPDA